MPNGLFAFENSLKCAVFGNIHVLHSLATMDEQLGCSTGQRTHHIRFFNKDGPRPAPSQNTAKSPVAGLCWSNV